MNVLLLFSIVIKLSVWSESQFFSIRFFFFFFLQRFQDLDSGLRKHYGEEGGGRGGKRKYLSRERRILDLFIVHAVFSRDTLAILSFGKTYCASHANSTRRTRVILFLIEKPLHDNFLAGSKLDRLFPPLFLLPRFLTLKPFDTRTFSNGSIIFFIEKKKKWFPRYSLK